MKKEKPAIISPRVYLRHRRIVRKWADRQSVSDAEIVRRAIDEYDETREGQKSRRVAT